MANTPYSKENAEDSNAAHLAAQSLVYPHLIGVKRELLEFVDCTGEGAKDRILDGEMAIDRMVKITVNGLKAPITLTVQERFRKMAFSKWRDITVTEWNPASNLPSELYKLTAGLFVYGYFDGASRSFGEVIMVNTSALLLAIAQNGIVYGKAQNPRSRQFFLTFKFNDLIKAGLVAAHYVPGGPQLQLPIDTVT